MAEATYDVTETVTETVAKAGLSGHYDENALYSNPAKNAKFGMSFNWHNNLVPNNVVDLIASHETVADGLLTAAEATLENTLNHRYFNDVDVSESDKKDWLIGLIQELARRDGKGAFGEIWARENAVVGTVMAPKPDDEGKGIDVRTDVTTYQVKTGDTFKSNWEKKEAKNLLWVKMDGNDVTGYELNP